MRRIGEAKLPNVKYRMRPGAYGIVMQRGHVMLVEELGSDENLQLPGGGIDPGENPTAALHREVMEETGWRIANLRRIGAFRRYPFMPEYGFWAEKICHIYVADPVRPHGPPTEPGHKVHWVETRLAISMLGTEGYRQFLSEILR